MRDHNDMRAAFHATVMSCLPALALLLLLTWSDAATASGADEPLDLLLLNGSVYTVDAANPWVEAVGIRDGRIVFLGSNAEAAELAGDAGRIIDLDGLMAMPGIHDSHIHLLEAFHGAWTCALPPGRPPERYIPILRACAPQQVGTDWVIGFGHSFNAMLGHLRMGGRAPVAILDEAIPDRPAVMLESTSHSVWANTLALQAAGFDADSPDPPGGVILRDRETGEPNGLLLDGAGEIAMDLAFAPNPVMAELNYRAVLRGLAFANRHGITSLADARTYWRRGYVEAYERAAQTGQLSTRVVLGLWAYPYLDDAQQLAQLASRYSNEPDARLRVSQIKVYSDGEISHTSAALLEPYVRWQLAGPRGLEYFDRARLQQYITQLEPLGFDFHIHGIGDRGVRQALDAVEAARSANGDLGARHHLTHLEVVAPEDIPRFATLDVVADVQTSSDFVLPENLPFYWPYLGPQRAAERVLRLRDLYESGARIVLSSDYDVGDLSPFKGMARAIDRGDQSLPDAEAAIRAYTINAAYLLRQEDQVGTLEIGKLADLILLDTNIVTASPAEIADTRVLMTLLSGEIVWEAAR